MTRQSWPKAQPRQRRPAQGFTAAVKQIIRRRSCGMCELDLCGPADHYHHRAPRGSGGSRLEWINSAANALHLASACHDLVERNRAEALENGWLVSRLAGETAAGKPVLYRGTRVLLSDDGSIRPAGGAA